MSGRKSLRLSRRRSHHVAAVEPLDDVINHAKVPGKRQRRLTTHQRNVNRKPTIAVDEPAAKKLAVAAAAAPKESAPPNNVQKLDWNKIGPVALDKQFKEVAAEPSVSASASDSDRYSESDSESGYVSSGPSVKMQPGKRIKWRVAISEEDIIIQNLSSAFHFVAKSTPLQTAPKSTGAAALAAARRKRR